MINSFNTDVVFPNIRKEYSDLGNPLYSLDIVNANQSLLTAMDALIGITDTSFAIIAGFDYNIITGAYGSGICYLNNKILFLPSPGINNGQQLTNNETDEVLKLMSDNLTVRPLYHAYLAKIGTGSTPVYSPVFSGGMNQYRLNLKTLQNTFANYYTKSQTDALLLGESWSYVGASGKPAFNSPWANVGGPDLNLRFKKIASNQIKIEGQINGGNSDTIIFVIPTGYYPTTYAQKMAICVLDGSANICSATLQIDTSGNVAVQAGALSDIQCVINVNYFID